MFRRSVLNRVKEASQRPPNITLIKDINIHDLERICQANGLQHLGPWPKHLPYWQDSAWARHNRPFLFVPVTNAHKASSEPIVVPFLFDTGAPASSIRRETAEKLGLGGIPSADDAKVAEFWRGRINIDGIQYDAELGTGLFENIDLMGADLAGLLELDILFNYRREMGTSKVTVVSRGSPKLVWVQSKSKNDTDSAFQVTPATNTIDSLKKAIKGEIGAKYPSLIAPDITIFDLDTKPVKKQSTPLKTNSEENPYLFELPKYLIFPN